MEPIRIAPVSGKRSWNVPHRASIPGSSAAIFAAAARPASVQKPAPEAAPSRLVIASRYIFTPRIFAALKETPAGRGGEIQLPDAMRKIIPFEPLYALRFEGRRYDIGNKLDFMKSTVEFGLRRPEFREALAEFIRNQARKLEENA